MSQDYEDEYDDGHEDERDERREDRWAGDEEVGPRRGAMQKTNVPGILLIIVGVLNLLGNGYLLVDGIIVLAVPKEMMKQQMQNVNPEQEKQLEQAGISMDKLIGGAGLVYLIAGALGLLVAILTIIAGAMIRSLRGYVLGVVCSILVCIPLLSFFGCCLLGQVAGIWALVVLLSADVKAAFR
jgi:hypothetical protein